jgi:hypothetical protein
MSETVDRVRVLHVEQSVDSRALAQYRSDGYVDAIRSQAARSLSDVLIREAAVEESAEEPDPERFYGGRTTFKYDVAVVMPENSRSRFADQLAAEREAGRVAGILEAAEAVRRKADIMRDIDGLIAFNIDAAATELRELARRPPPNHMREE